MSEGANPPRRAVPDPEEMPWSISYLRDDIKELRAEVGARFGAVHNRIDETSRSLSDRIDETSRSLNDRIDETSRSLNDRIDETNKRLDIHFRWIMGTLVTLTGVLIAVIKL